MRQTTLGPVCRYCALEEGDEQPDSLWDATSFAASLNGGSAPSSPSLIHGEAVVIPRPSQLHPKPGERPSSPPTRSAPKTPRKERPVAEEPAEPVAELAEEPAADPVPAPAPEAEAGAPAPKKRRTAPADPNAHVLRSITGRKKTAPSVDRPPSAASEPIRLSGSRTAAPAPRPIVRPAPSPMSRPTYEPDTDAPASSQPMPAEEARQPIAAESTLPVASPPREVVAPQPYPRDRDFLPAPTEPPPPIDINLNQWLLIIVGILVGVLVGVAVPLLLSQ